MRIEKNSTAIRSFADWERLAPPKKGAAQWKAGRSAWECAKAWCPPSGPCVPEAIRTLLDSHTATRGCALVHVEPEVRVRFDEFRGEPRNADVVALAEHPKGVVAISIEAKADEPFDLLVDDVVSDVSRRICDDKPSNRIARVQQLARSLLPARGPGTVRLGELRYQLLTALAGGVAHANAHGAGVAVLAIHEFRTSLTDDDRHDANAADLDRFVARLTCGEIRAVVRDELVEIRPLPGRPLFDRMPRLLIGKAVTNLRPPVSG